ncbi:MAG: G8 domain-containing protein, partial [Gemmataceae bacterium]
GRLPPAGAIVLIRAGHAVVYDRDSAEAIRSLHVSGVLTFAADRDTRLDVGLVRIQAGDTVDEEGFDCSAHVKPDDSRPRPEFLVGAPDTPILAGKTARIRLVYFDGMDRKSCPAIVCCGGRMEFHGAPLSRTWVKLGAPVETGQSEVMLDEPVTGWRVGDRVILTATTRQNKVKKTFKPSVRDDSQTEERFIKAVDGVKLTLDRPLTFAHFCKDAYRGEIANLSRNVVVESAEPDKARGHTMYHRHSAGSISYAEFRHLGMPGVLGRYSLHYHLAGDTMRGSSVIGASIWDSGNRWLTIHGTNYLVVRDCVGYQSMGHGFFLEDGTEVNNILDRNLAVQAYATKPLPEQILPFDKNDGSGFWWANCRNSFTRNVAAECDEYGYFFQVEKTAAFNPVLPILQPDGAKKAVDIRTLPFIRFEDNETHCQRRHGFNLGGGVPFGPGVAGVGPDEKHPFVIKNFRSWNVHWAIHPVSPSLLIDGLDVFNAEYGVWRPVYRNHAYRGIAMHDVPDKLHYAFVSPAKAPNDAKDYPGALDPIDDLPPVTVITHVMRVKGKTIVRGTTADNGAVKRVLVNDQSARPLRPNFAEWEAILEETGVTRLSAHAEDAAGNRETMKHEWRTPEGERRH